jgi:hypothetical protein
MEIHFGVVRDKQGIHSSLVESRKQHRQLAVCYSSEGKLIVKICIVKEIEKGNDGTWISVLSPDDDNSETRIHLDHIQSVYPIRDFA